MTILAFCLIAYEHEKAEARRAAMVFFIMSHAGSGLLLAGFLVLAAFTGTTDFTRLPFLEASQLPIRAQSVVFLLFFAGFGVKSGIIPLHIWLPDAHPVAPATFPH